MRTHQEVQLFKRRMPPSRCYPRGRVIWYYRVWLGENRRTAARSTGCSLKSDAQRYIENLRTKGELIPTGEGPPRWVTFGDLAKDFWKVHGDYVTNRLRFSDPNRPAISEQYVKENARAVRLHLLPEFKKRRLEDMTPQTIESSPSRSVTAVCPARR